jgi:hypothetical protein
MLFQRYVSTRRWKPHPAEFHPGHEARSSAPLHAERMANNLSEVFSGAEGLLIGAVLIVFLIIRQFSVRRILNPTTVIAPAILLYLGAQDIGSLDASSWVLLGISASLAAAFGMARGVTFRVWTNPRGDAMMQGTRATLALWIATIALKAALTFAESKFGFGARYDSTVLSLVPAAVTIGVQQLVVYLRAVDRRGAEYSVS